MASNPFDAKHFPNCHRGHKYAEDVVRGDIPASKYLIGACERYLGEVELEDHPNFYFDPKKAERFLRLAQKFDHVIGKWKTRKIIFEPWQCWVWMNIMGFISRKTGFRRFRIAHVECARGNSKAFHVLTKVPTPDGIKLWGDIGIGSRLFDRNGRVCRVIGKTPIHRPPAREISFSDGTKIITSHEHLWFTEDVKERDRAFAGSSLPHESVKTTDEIRDTLKYSDGSNNHAVRVSSPVGGYRRMDYPYFWGYWIGNGALADSRIAASIKDSRKVREFLISDGMSVSPLRKVKGKEAHSFRPYGVRRGRERFIKDGKKYIPDWIVTLNKSDRLKFLMGLMDSDGTAHVSGGQSIFGTIHRDIAEQVRVIVCSLGIKATIKKEFIGDRKRLRPRVSEWFYRVSFTTNDTVFRLPRKQKRAGSKSPVVKLRYITGVRELPSEYDMFCVEVDSPDSSYLISESYIPTHNSAMASIAALYFMSLDNPQGNQVATVATKKDQARIVLDSARAMARKNKSFTVSMGVRVLAHSIVQDKTNSNIRALSAEASSLDGLNDVLAVCDELHAMKRETFDVIYSGMSKRSDSLTLCITTAGFDVDSVGFTQSSYAKKVALGEFKDEQFFSAVYCLDEGDDIYDERNWIKANPNWGVSVDPITFRAKAEKTKRSPNDLPNFKVKHLDMWVSEAKAFFDQKQWDKCADPNLKIEDFLNERCRMGIDLASHIDLTSIGIIFFKNGKYYVFDRTFIPEVTMSERESENEIYADAVSKGFLIKTPGAAINNDFIRAEAIALASKFRVSECFYDTWNATEMAQKLSDKIEMVKFGMNTANLSEPMKRLDSLMREGKIVHCGSPLMRWCIGNVVAKADHNDNVYPRKTHVRLKIDPVIAVLMALAGWIQDDNKESVYETRGLRILG